LKLWKVLGVAGLAGVAATGVTVARAERRRRAYGPEDVRARLHERYEEATSAEEPPGPAAAQDAPGGLKAAWTRIRGGRRRPRQGS